MVDRTNDHDAIVIDRGPVRRLTRHKAHTEVISVGICEAKLIGEVATGVGRVIPRRLRDECTLILDSVVTRC